VVAVDNRDLRLKPGMTANVSMVVAQRDDVLKVPSSALRFTPPAIDRGEGYGTETKTVKAETRSGGGHPSTSSMDPATPARKVWMLSATGEPEPTLVETGISDGVSTEVMAGPLAEGDLVIVGIESPRGERKSGDLPPGFGTGQRRSSRS
jgi:HlyD family secretion protein